MHKLFILAVTVQGHMVHIFSKVHIFNNAEGGLIGNIYLIP